MLRLGAVRPTYEVGHLSIIVLAGDVVQEPQLAEVELLHGVKQTLFVRLSSCCLSLKGAWQCGHGDLPPLPHATLWLAISAV